MSELSIRTQNLKVLQENCSVYSSGGGTTSESILTTKKTDGDTKSFGITDAKENLLSEKLKQGSYADDPKNSTIALMQKDEQFLEEAKTDRKLAEEKWLTAQFEGLDLNNEKDFAKIKEKMEDLWNNCATLEEKIQLAGIVERTAGEYFRQIHNNEEAMCRTLHAAYYGDDKDKIETVGKVSEAARKKRISEETAVNITYAVPEVFNKEVRADAAKILNESGIEEVTKALCRNIREGDKYTGEDVDSILNGYLDNAFLTEEQKHDLSGVIGFGTVDKQLEHHKRSAEYYAKNQDVAGMNATAEGIRYYAAENQAPAAEEHFNTTLMLESPEHREDAQLTLTNQIEYFDASAQAEAHRIVCQSEFESVLTQAAENIYKYDESAQNDALNYTIATGNEKAIETAVETAEKCKAQSTSSKYYDSETAESVKTYQLQMFKKEIEQSNDTADNYNELLQPLTDEEQKLQEEQEYYKEDRKNIQNPDKKSNAQKIYNDCIKNSPDKKENLEELITQSPDIIMEWIRMGKGDELLEILGNNSPYAEKIAEWMHKCHLRIEEETYSLNPGTEQTVRNTVPYELADINSLLMNSDKKNEKEYYLQA